MRVLKLLYLLPFLQAEVLELSVYRSRKKHFSECAPLNFWDPVRPSSLNTLNPALEIICISISRYPIAIP